MPSGIAVTSTSWSWVNASTTVGLGIGWHTLEVRLVSGGTVDVDVAVLE